MDDRIGFGLCQSGGNRGALDVCLCLSCGGVDGTCGVLGPWSGRMGCCRLDYSSHSAVGKRVGLGNFERAG